MGKMNALASILPPISSRTRLNSFLDLSLWLILAHCAEFCVVHVAEKQVKANAKRSDVEKPEGAEGQQPVRSKLEAFWKFIDERLEIIMRLFSPLFYTLV